MQITFNTDSMSNALLFDITNAVSKDIDELASNDSLSMTQCDYNWAMAELTDKFNILCKIAESRVREISDFIVIPKYI